MANSEAWNRRRGRTSSWIRPVRRLAIYLRDSFRCQWCGKDLRWTTPRDLTLDHLRPRCKGGTHRSDNLVTACLSCNSSRQDTRKTFPYAARLSHLRKLARQAPFTDLARFIFSNLPSSEPQPDENR